MKSRQDTQIALKGNSFIQKVASTFKEGGHSRTWMRDLPNWTRYLSENTYDLASFTRHLSGWMRPLSG